MNNFSYVGTHTAEVLEWINTRVFGNGPLAAFTNFGRIPENENLVFFITDGVSTLDSDLVAPRAQTLNDLARVRFYLWLPTN